ncbi:alpha/beta hydrolase [Mariniblastus sp.]|nr:alpha/beta hydrolase [Mariniblastus sp.]
MKIVSKPATVCLLICLLMALPASAQDSGSVEKPSPTQQQSAEKTKPKKKKKKKPRVYDASVPKPTISEVKYGDHRRQVMDFWKAESTSPTPLVFVIHGGGWRNGSKERVASYVDVAEILEAGISVVAINYRLLRQAGKVKPPVQVPIGDAARALQFVRSKAEEWNIDKQRIGATGSSAGACSSLWLAFHDDLADPTSDDPIARESTRLWCAGVRRAQTNLDPKLMKEWTPNSKYGHHAFGKKDFEEFLADRDELFPLIEQYSPMHLVTEDDPDIYIWYGTPPAMGQEEKDPTHTANFGIKLQELCQTMGVGCEIAYPEAPNVKHETPTDYLIATLKKDQ